MQTGKLQFNIAPFVLTDLIEDSVENVQHMYSSHKIIKPAVIPDITLKGDKLRLEQALTNFLINAVKYSPKANKVFVATRVDDNEVKIDITDTGIGISENDQRRIFDRFYRVEDTSTISGIGMGLYITQEIIKRHHGKVTVRSQLGKGSTFSICLPLKSIESNKKGSGN